MNKYFRKLVFSISVLIGAGIFSLSASARSPTTNYDFTWTSNAVGSVTGILTVDTVTNKIVDIYGTVNAGSGSGAITSLYAPNGFNGNDNSFRYPAVPYITDSGFSFTTATGSFNIGGYGGVNAALYNGSSTNMGTLSASLSGAPEIDGSLAPKVGFLLGCLFLMFGRRSIVITSANDYLSKAHHGMV